MSLKKLRRSRKERCRARGHNPPQHYAYRPGEYEWTCPACGNVQRFTVNGPVW